MWRSWDKSNQLSSEPQQLLRALANGDTLKAHRQLDGSKVYRLHSLDGKVATVAPAPAVEDLLARGLVASNLKFPAAVLLLTEKGVALAATQRASGSRPVGPRQY